MQYAHPVDRRPGYRNHRHRPYDAAPARSEEPHVRGEFQPLPLRKAAIEHFIDGLDTFAFARVSVVLRQRSHPAEQVLREFAEKHHMTVTIWSLHGGDRIVDLCHGELRRPLLNFCGQAGVCTRYR